MRIEWLQWSVSDGYEKILEDMYTLLPLLRKKYSDPMLASNAIMMHEEFHDVIPDEYVDFLHDILIMLCSVYNKKYEQIQEDRKLWEENYELMMNIHHIVSFLYSTLAWHVFDTVLEENSHSVKYLARELIKGINVLYF
jgi:mannose/fructose/N-acetylgalactosamine-specific phosphotransferase system component IID